MYHFCTYFDHGYLPRGLALYHSLRRHCPAFRLWVLCFDAACYSALAALALPEVELIALDAFERGDDELLGVKASRSKIEYYFTTTPSLPLYIFAHWPEVELITYLDADLFFFADPRPIFQAIGQQSIAITPHRFTPENRHLEIHGRFNVGWVSFRRDAHGLACLRWWRERCLEWCYDRPEPGRFGDQKYLDVWPERFAGVHILEQKGVNLAPWNVGAHSISSRGGAPWVDDEPLICYHFHAFRQPRAWLYDPRLANYRVRPSQALLRHVYVPYIHALAAVSPARPIAMPARRHGRIMRHLHLLSQLLELGRGLLGRRYIMALQGRLIFIERPLRPIVIGAMPGR